MYTNGLDETAIQFYSRAGGRNVAGATHAMTIGGYELGEEIGRGGMSVVYRAVRKTDGAPVAVKVFDVPAGPCREELARKFVQETKLLSVLDHPNLIKVFDAGATDDGRPWLAMELVEGYSDEGSLRLDSASLATRLCASKPIAPTDVVSIYSQLRAALAYCHGKGIVHGDVKAENVLIASDGTVKLSDFGIARILYPDTRRQIGVSTVTLDGNLGTPYARAPECRRGEKATAAADVYSFGVLLYKLVTGIWYEGSKRLLLQTQTFAPDWAPTLVKMLCEDPALRYANAAALPADPTAEARHRRRAHHALTAVLLAVAALLAGFAAWRLATTRQVTETPSTAEAKPSVATFMPSVTTNALVGIPTRQERPAVNVQGGERKLSDDEWARYFLGTNAYDYVEEATLTRTNRLVLTRPVMYGTLHLPDTNGTVEVESPPGYEGYIVLARHIDGDMFYQMHVQRKGELRVRASNRAIRVSCQPFPRNPEP